ncbi:type II secretion system F family protein [Alicyclobacillus acidocaldarius]|uniref:Flp pilus assembly protein TadB-like protein n=1 Tax=Alicyclobacillus acidocaldarius (strain Tc-4-1) TaxID=1048834 RepID=F8IGM7_ALIAT|nr:type II secretion system F family protein [Alicyclobacillus acidocaldarius]AEJ44307.1 Flp pilus assembly protein TadB-like protein [Alicyclobacillus acidocaldarius subsp. acidocaldarius Tc-4-1]
MAYALGVLMALAVLIGVVGTYLADQEQERLFRQSVHGTFRRPKPKQGFLESLHQNLVFFAREIGHPEWADLAYRVSFAMPVLVLALFLLLGLYWAFPFAAFAFFLPYVYLSRLYKRARLLLKKQLRQARLLIALLTEAGAPIERGILAAESVANYPLKPYLRDVCIAIGAAEGMENVSMRVETVVEAFMTMAERLRLPEATQFAQLLSQATRYHTPLVDMMLTSLEIEERIRDAEAEHLHNSAVAKIGLISTLGMGIPVFGYIFFAVLSYAMKLFASGFGVGIAF